MSQNTAQDYFKGSILDEVITGTINSDAVNVRGAKTVAISGFVDVTTPSAVSVLPPAINVADNEITSAAHGMETGLKVQAAVSSVLPAPLSATNYYAIVVDANTIKVATSNANAVAGTAVNITDVGVGEGQFTPQVFSNSSFNSNDVNTGSEEITITAHGYVTGARVQVSTSSTSLPAPLAAATDYYVIRVDANTIKLATSVANALAGTAIDLTTVGTATSTVTPQSFSNRSFADTDVNDGTDQITITGHGWITGTSFQLSTVGTLPAPFVAATDYYAIVIDANTIEVAATVADALAGTQIDITTTGTGTFNATVGVYAAKTFLNTGVNIGTEEITSAANGFFTGLSCTLTTNGVLPTGLALVTTYYIISVDANTFQLAASYADAIAGTEIDLTAAGGATVTVTVAVYNASTFLSTNVTPAADTIAITAHGYFTGVEIALVTLATLPSPLVALTDYFIINVSANVFKLAASLVLALAGTAIDITDDGQGQTTFTPVALAGGNAKLQFTLNTDESSLVSADWNDVPTASVSNASQNITAEQLVYFEKIDPPWAFVRVQCTLTAGQFNPQLSALTKQ